MNELIRSDGSWSGYERNVLYANNGDGTFSEVSGAAGMDFPEDSRSFALADLDHDGRLEVVLKNRNAPQLRILHNVMEELGASIAFRLRGTKSNRDGIGAAITLEAGALRQTRYCQAGSGFLAQHSKEVCFGVGKAKGTVRATVRWPSGLTQSFEALPVDHSIELEEGSATFTSKSFTAAPPAWANTAPAIHGEALPEIPETPETIDTWLLEPLKAPAFSLPDLTGSMRELRSFQGGFVLLNFWSTASQVCAQQLRLFHEHRPGLDIVAVCVDSEAKKVTDFTTPMGLGFPVLLATEEVAGVYNIIYRYLFDRRRDLGLPTSFLLDKEGMIIKVYQGTVDPQLVVRDMRSAPNTAADRMRKALPFPGVAYQQAFLRNDFTYGVAMFQHGYLEQAAESFQQVIAAKPDDAEGYYNLGTLNLRRNDFQQARYYLQQTLKLRPNYPEAWNNLGMIAAQEGHGDEAVQSFQQALLLRPGYTTALENLGNVYRRQRSYPEAQKYLEQALALQADDPEINYSLGMLYAQQGQLQTAYEYLQRAADLRPDYPEALNNLGVLFVRQQDFARAEEQFKKCIQLAPGFDQSYLNLARLYALRGDKEQAREVLQELLRLHPDNAGARQALGTLQ